MLTPANIATGTIIAIVFGLLKPFAEVVIRPGAKLHDPALRLLVLVIGAIVGFCQAALIGAPLDPHGVISALLDGVKEGLVAIAAYHLVPGDIWPSEAPVQVQKTSTTTTSPIVLPGADMGQSVAS